MALVQFSLDYIIQTHCRVHILNLLNVPKENVWKFRVLKSEKVFHFPQFLMFRQPMNLTCNNNFLLQGHLSNSCLDLDWNQPV